MFIGFVEDKIILQYLQKENTGKNITTSTKSVMTLLFVSSSTSLLDKKDTFILRIIIGESQTATSKIYATGYVAW
jgi:hypothetical protein